VKHSLSCVKDTYALLTTLQKAKLQADRRNSPLFPLDLFPPCLSATPLSSTIWLVHVTKWNGVITWLLDKGLKKK